MTNESFPPEITREILLNLPVESLLRCKSVCKEWYSLISDNHFIKSHYTLSSTNNINYTHRRLICNIYYDQQYLISCLLRDALINKFINNETLLENELQPSRYEKVRIVGSCNGLICTFKENERSVFIYNPTTRRSNLLPCCQRIGLWEVYYGFGYDELSDDYKVVAIGMELIMPTVIYSLKTGKWREIGNFPCAGLLDDGKLINGVLHWAPGESNPSDSWKIVSLDLANETYGEVLQPEFNKGHGYLDLGVLGECLCALYDWVESCVVDVWVMKVYGVKDSWTKLASIPYPPTGVRISAPFLVLAEEKLLLRVGRQLLVYESKDGSSSMIKNECNDACIVVESLVSPFPPLGLADINDDGD